MAEKLTKTDEDFYSELIAKELSGELSESERAKLLEWVNRSEENRAFYKGMTSGWEKTAVAKNEFPDFDTKAAWMNVKARTIDAGISTPGKEIPLNSRFTTLKVAATILLIVGLCALIRITLFNAPEAVNFATLDNKQVIYLPDSSKVLLNKNSHLTYFTDFNSKERKVYLEGQAFFEVRKSEGKKFEVYGVRSVTTVLGTSFSVRSMKNEPKEIVQVVTGKVSMAELEHREKNEIILTPGLQGELDQSSQLSKHEISDPNFMAWRQNRLTFDNTELSAVVETLEEYFGTEIEVRDPLLLSCRFTGTFDKPTVDEVLQILAISTNSSYKTAGPKIILTGKGCTKN